MLVLCELSAKYVYISVIGSFFSVRFYNDHLLFYLLYIVTKNILYKTNLLSMQRNLNLKATSGITVLTLPDRKTIHFVYVFGFGNLYFPCNWCFCDSLEFMAWRGKQKISVTLLMAFAGSFSDPRLVEACLNSVISGFS